MSILAGRWAQMVKAKKHQEHLMMLVIITTIIMGDTIREVIGQELEVTLTRTRRVISAAATAPQAMGVERHNKDQFRFVVSEKTMGRRPHFVYHSLRAVLWWLLTEVVLLTVVAMRIKCLCLRRVSLSICTSQVIIRFIREAVRYYCWVTIKMKAPKRMRPNILPNLRSLLSLFFYWLFAGIYFTRCMS